LEIIVSNPHQDLISLTADIVSAHVSHNKIDAGEVANLIQATFEALALAGAPAPEPEPAQEPAVPIRLSVKADHIVCLEDGKKLKMLKRYLRTNYNMTPEDYRAKWKLPRDYPMVAPAYADQRRDLAKMIGLGRKPAAAKKTAAKGINAGLEAARAHLGSEPSTTPAAKRGRPAKAKTEADTINKG
jgi:predicted transcriptional regulator